VAVTKASLIAAEPGDTLTLTAGMSDLAGNPMAGDYEIVWTSAKTSVAEVADGVITAVGKGSAKITASYTDASGKKSNATCTVTVGWMSDTVTTTQAEEQAVAAGKAITLKASAGRLDGQTAANTSVVWSSSDETVATVTAAGKVTGVSIGEVVITATAADGSGASISFTITVTPNLTKVAVKPTTVTVAAGDTLNVKDYLTFTGTGLEGQEEWLEHVTITYTISASQQKYATVDEDGNVTTLAKGTAKITAKITCGTVTKSVTLTVKVTE